MVARPRVSLWKWLVPVACVVLVWATRAAWLAAAGQYLIRTDPPFAADIVVVPGGDGYGHRILKAAEVVRQGLARQVLVSGPDGMYGLHESDLAIPFAVRHGNPQEWFVPLVHEGTSTREEAGIVAAELRRRGVRRCLLVTSDYHTRRAGRLFRRAAPEIEFRVLAAPDEFFRASQWWRSREGQKVFVLEWTKTAAMWFGL